MASSTNSSTTGLEGHSINIPPLFDGTNYQFWSTRMSIFMRSCDYHIWDVVVNGSFVSMRKIRASGEQVPKQRSEWTNGEVKKIEINFKAINILLCSKSHGIQLNFDV